MPQAHSRLCGRLLSIARHRYVGFELTTALASSRSAVKDDHGCGKRAMLQGSHIRNIVHHQTGHENSFDMPAQHILGPSQMNRHGIGELHSLRTSPETPVAGTTLSGHSQIHLGVG